VTNRAGEVMASSIGLPEEIEDESLFEKAMICLVVQLSSILSRFKPVTDTIYCVDKASAHLHCLSNLDSW